MKKSKPNQTKNPVMSHALPLQGPPSVASAILQERRWSSVERPVFRKAVNASACQLPQVKRS